MNHFILQIFLLTVFFILFFNFISNVIYVKENMEDPNPSGEANSRTNILTNKVDAMFLYEKSNEIEKIKKELFDIRKKLYNIQYEDILKLEAKYKPTSLNKVNTDYSFSASMNSRDRFNNIITLEVPEGPQGPEGLQGDPGVQGDEGPPGDQGDEGHLGITVAPN